MPFITVRDDITRMKVDAIVNPANTGLRPGGGCCGAIFRAAGAGLAGECARLGSCPTGEARITAGYELPAKYVIHTPGPVWHGGDCGEERLLKSCYTESLRLAARNGCASIAFPLISSGIFGYPPFLALTAAREAVTEWLMNEDTEDTLVYLVLFDRGAFDAGRKYGAIEAYINDNYEGIERYRAESLSRKLNCSSFFSRSDERVRPSELFANEDASEGMQADKCFISAPLQCSDRQPADGALPDDFFGDLDEGFSAMLIRLIDAKGMKDSDVYKRANRDRKLFNKIKLNPDYHPGKQTALAFAVALRLDYETAKELLSRAGFAFSRASKGDLIVEYYIKNGNYDIMEINETLFQYDQEIL